MRGWEALSDHVKMTIAGIFALLVLATVITRLMALFKPDKDFTELRARVKTWWLMIGIFTLALLLSRTVSLVFFAFVSFLALKEFLSLIPTRRADRRVIFWAYIAIPIQYYWIYEAWYGMFIIFIPVFLFLFLPLRMILVGETEGFLRSAGTLHWGLMTMVFSISHAAFLLVLQFKGDPSSFPGPGLMLFLVLLTQGNDIAQYLWGRSLGKRKIVPKVSPGKTWIGFLGGVATTTAAAFWLGPLLTPMNVRQAALAGVIIAVGGFVGDVTMSALKRDLNVKDSGSTLPGHGGIIDRIDSLIFTAPLFFHYIYYLFTWHTHGATIG